VCTIISPLTYLLLIIVVLIICVNVLRRLMLCTVSSCSPEKGSEKVRVPIFNHIYCELLYYSYVYIFIMCRVFWWCHHRYMFCSLYLLWFQLGKFTGIKAATVLGGDRSVYRLAIQLLITVSFTILPFVIKECVLCVVKACDCHWWSIWWAPYAPLISHSIKLTATMNICCYFCKQYFASFFSINFPNEHF